MSIRRLAPARFAGALYALTLIFSLAISPLLHAQVAGTGSVQGEVVDSTGARIPTAAVTLTAEATGVVRTATTDKAGLFVFPNITPGTYTVSITADGFKRFSKTHNVLEVGSNISVDAKLPAGGASESVTVEAEGIALQTEDPKFKQTVDEQQIAELPLNSASRQVTGLISLAGGATPAPGGDFTGSKYSYQTISISVAGGQGNTTIWRLDGGDNNDYMANVNLPFPFPDALSQFSVETTVLGAQDGIHSGGLVNAVTRSGTNQFHGNLFEFIRNNYINARNFYSAAPDSLHQNQFGGTFGGPILRDKLFAFAGYQRLMAQQSSSPTTVHLPTAANLLGDFSVTDPVSGGNACRSSAIQLKDPLTGNNIPGNKYATTPTWNAAALAIYKLLPTPTDQACGTYVYTVPTVTRDNQFVSRVDWSISSKHNFFGRYFIDGYQQPSVYNPSNILVTTQSGNLERFQTLTFGENWAISSRTVNAAHVTLSRIRNNRGYAANAPNASAFGINVYQYSPAGLYYTVSNKFNIGCGTCIAAIINDNTFNATDELTLVRGHHSIVVGAEFVRNQLNFRSGFNSNGNFATSGVYSGSGPNGGSTLGDGDLDFLFGLQSSFQQSPQQQEALRGNIPSIYVQDTWHAAPRLTLVAGIRWSPDFFPVDYFNRGSVFSMSAFLAGQASTVFPTAPAGSLFYGDPGVGRNFTSSSPWLFSPNVGFSFDPVGNGKTVIRGGYELIYDQPNFYTGQRDQQNPPFAPNISQSQTSTSGPISLTNPWSTGTVTSSPFPQPARSASTVSFFPQTQWVVLPSKFRPAYSSQYTMSIQHTFSHGYQMQVDYIGSATFRMPLGVPLNPVNFVAGVWGAGGTGCASVVRTGPAAAKPGAAGTNCSTTANAISRATLTQLNPVQGNYYAVGGTGSASTQILNEAVANYNGVIVSLQRRLSASFSLLTNYTYSKCLDIVDAQGDIAATSVSQPFNLSADYGPCGSDYRHIFNTAVVASAKFPTKNHLLAAVVNGWQIAPLVHITSGAPINVTTGTDVSLTSVGSDRPNIVASAPHYLNQKLYSGTGQALRGYLNPAAFTSAPTGSFGNLGRNAFRAGKYIQTDASLSRFFPVHDAMKLQLRLEAFNVLNHPYFSTPTATTGSSTFGQIGSTTGEGPRVFQGAFKFSF
ncbi:MAG: carboxypeptidase-like regulatory domain-containing protein [Granulicella sp.]